MTTRSESASESGLERVTLGDLTLAYQDTGRGDPCLLLHGFPFDHTQWHAQLPDLTPATRLILPDLRGHGASDAPPPPYRLTDFADDVRALIDRLGLERVVLGGLSMGGYIALAFAQRYPERLQGLILLSTRAEADTPEIRQGRQTTIARVQEGGAEAIVDELGQRILGERETPAAITRAVHDWILGAPVDGLIGSLGAMATRTDVTPFLSRLTCPTLIMVGTEDQLTPPDAARTMASAIPGAELVEVPGTAHLLTLERPDIVNPVLASFLARCRG